MTENFLSKAFADGKVFAKTVNMVTQLSRLKLAIRAKQKEKSQMMRSVGVAIFEIYHEQRKLDSGLITNAVINDLETIKNLTAEITDLTSEAERVKADFRSAQSVKPNDQQPPTAK